MKKYTKFVILFISLIAFGAIIYFGYATNNEKSNSGPEKTSVKSILAESLSLDERIQQAEIIVKGKVTSQLPSQNVKTDKREYIYTDYSLEVNEYLKNPLAYDNLIVRIEGGKTLTEEMFVEDAVTLTVGEEVILFLTKNNYLVENSEANTYTILLGEDGNFAINNKEASGGYNKETYELDKLIAEITK